MVDFADWIPPSQADSQPAEEYLVLDGTAQQLNGGAGAAFTTLTIEAVSGNSDPVYLGGSAVGDANNPGLELQPGQSWWTDKPGDVSDFYALGTAGEHVRVLWQEVA